MPDKSPDSGKRMTVYPNLLSGAVFFLLGLALLALLPGYVRVAENDVVNGRVFPRLLILLMMIAGAVLVVRDVVKLLRKQPVETKTIDLLVDAKAALIFAILLAGYLLAWATGLFIVGACFVCVAFLLYFRCRNANYYAITLTCAVIIWAGFRFILNVDF